MLKPLQDPLADRDDRAFGTDPPPSGRYAGDSPADARSHSLFWWVVVIIAFIL